MRRLSSNTPQNSGFRFPADGYNLQNYFPQSSGNNHIRKDNFCRYSFHKGQTRYRKSFDIPFEVHIYSAHRTPVEARDFAISARDNGFGVLIAAAGMAAHLAGAIAANTTLPVIGIPCKSSVLDGMDALLSTVQMPTGIPVATVAINGGANAALLAAQILAVSDSDLAKKLDEKRANDAKAVLAKDASVMEKL